MAGPGVASHRQALAAFQAVVGDQPGVAGTLGPATRPTPQDFGIVAAAGGEAVRYVIVSADDPLSATAVRLQCNLALRTDGLLDAVGLPHTRALFAGDTAITGELIDTARGDLLRVAPLVLLAVALVLAVFMRALVRPVYRVLLAALAPLAALGLAATCLSGDPRPP